MRDIDTLYSQIREAIRWNAFSYTVFKLTSTALTFVLFKQLNTPEFALWTGINSLVYLILLWADFGMRKTIPTFLPHIEESQKRTCIVYLICAYTCVLAFVCPLTLWLVARYAYSVTLPINNALLTATAILFFGHGLEMLFQTIFHAYLWHKTFNSLLAIIQFTYMLMTIVAVVLIPASYQMVFYIILGKGIASLFCTCISALLLGKLLPPKGNNHTPINRTLLHQFLTHGALMWIATVFKSLSERNVTVPFVTYVLGPTVGNIFKVTQEGALLLQRLIYRTIGTTDTSLFAHVKKLHAASESEQHHLKNAFTALSLKFAYLTMPLLGLVWFMQCQIQCCDNVPYGFTLFFIISLALLLELLFTPYERLLEVHAEYTNLTYVYALYLVGITATFGALIYAYVYVIGFIIALYAVRLVSMGMMAYAVHKKYKVRYPFAKVGALLVITLVTCYLLHLILYQFCGTALIDFFNYFFSFAS